MRDLHLNNFIVRAWSRRQQLGRTGWISLSLEPLREEGWKYSCLLRSHEHVHRPSPRRAPGRDGQSSPHGINRDARVQPPRGQSDAQDPSAVPEAPLSSGAGRE